MEKGRKFKYIPSTEKSFLGSNQYFIIHWDDFAAQMKSECVILICVYFPS